MKIFAFLVCLGLFVGSFALFGYAFAVDEAWQQSGCSPPASSRSRRR